VRGVTGAAEAGLALRVEEAATAIEDVDEIDAETH
jgi:hypothetical protein